MYINIKILKSKNLTLSELAYLQVIRQNKTEKLNEEIEIFLTDDLEKKWIEIGYIDYVKAKNKNQTKFELVRTTKKANEVLDNIEIADVNEDSLRIFEWLKDIYLRADKKIGNEKVCKRYIAQFSAESGIHKNELAILIKTFLSSENDFEYSQIMQNLFYKGETVFNIRFDINQSRLYQFYLKHKDMLDAKFKEL